MNEENKMYNYLLNHNYISENKKSNYQSELSIERTECIVNKFNSLVEEENANLKQALIDIREYVNNNCVFIDDSGYKKLIGYPKEMFDAQDILQIIDKVDLGDDEK